MQSGNSKAHLTKVHNQQVDRNKTKIGKLEQETQESTKYEEELSLAKIKKGILGNQEV